MNDPNGLIRFKGVYHLFYQHNPSGNTAGNGSWGHATSTDLVHWTEHPVAIAADTDEEVWSGSVVLDRTNSSGFGTETNPPLVAIYTSHDRHTGLQRQALAYSLDAGETWTKYDGNPVLDIGSHDFRDPKVSWNAQTGRWDGRGQVGRTEGRDLLQRRSQDLAPRE
jgi:fructan beta-fructosidase